MHISVSLLFLFIGSTSAKKEGNFGLFTACIKNNTSLRLECKYAPCPLSPPYSCEFWDSDKTKLEPEPNHTCKVVLQNHKLIYGSVITNYTCKLLRKDRPEEKLIKINYSGKGKDRIKDCPGATGLLLHQTPASLWPVVTVSLWTVLLTDRQPT